MELGLDELEREIITLAYAYVEVQRIRGSLESKHGKSKRKNTSFSPIHSLRKEALKMIGFGEEKIEELRKKEKEIKKALEKNVSKHPLWTWASKVKGLGKLSTGLVMAAIGDISRVQTCSGLWKSFGLDVTPEGKARKMIPGKKGRVGFPFARRILGRIRRQILFHKDGFYYKLYLQYRLYYDNFRPDWPKGRRFGAAIRATEKIFLSHFWEVWRKSKNLPAPEPYMVAQNPLLHRKISPEDAINKMASSKSKGKEGKPF